jgi:hypothetical protein
MAANILAVRMLLAATVRVLPEQLDLFTACNGGAGLGGVIGGAVALLAGEDVAKGGVFGAVIGLALGAFAAVLLDAVVP